MMSYQNGKVERGFNLWRNWGEIHRVWIRWRQGKCASNLDWRTAPGGGETMGMEVSCFPWGIFLIRFFGPIFVGPEPTLLCLCIYIYICLLLISDSIMDLDGFGGFGWSFSSWNQTCWHTRGICKLMASGGYLKLCVLGLSRLWSYQAFCPLFFKNNYIRYKKVPHQKLHII